MKTIHIVIICIALFLVVIGTFLYLSYLDQQEDLAREQAITNRQSNAFGNVTSAVTGAAKIGLGGFF